MATKTLLPLSSVKSSESGVAMPSPRVEQGSRARVLVVDDELDMLETSAAILATEFEVLTARNGELALSILQKTPVHVVCTDYNMPGITGLELLRQVTE